MAYDLTYNGIEGQGGLYARVQRLMDGKWWDQVNSVWIVAVGDDCNILMAEDTPGQYSAAAGLVPAKGGVYVVAVYTVDGILLMRTNCPYSPDQRSVLTIINDVQRELRLPQTSVIAFTSSAHAQLLLGFLNKTMDLMMEHSPSASLTIEGAFQTVAGMSYYPVAPVNFKSGVDTLDRLQIDACEPLLPVTSDQMKDYRRSNTQQGQPIFYRVYNRQGGIMVLEFALTPDKAYVVDFKGLLRVSRLTAATDIPVLDSDTIHLGVLWMAKQDQGEEFQVDLAAFQAKMSLHNPTGGTSGDIDFL